MYVWMGEGNNKMYLRQRRWVKIWFCAYVIYLISSGLPRWEHLWVPKGCFTNAQIRYDGQTGQFKFYLEQTTGNQFSWCCRTEEHVQLLTVGHATLHRLRSFGCVAAYWVQGLRDTPWLFLVRAISCDALLWCARHKIHNGLSCVVGMWAYCPELPQVLRTLESMWKPYSSSCEVDARKQKNAGLGMNQTILS